ncbi:hypothetical protein PWT90_04504 [Aphanocladium album]|nr:hypothetical protein PWT90_04504 [Aphanocladium album]
MVAQYHAPCGRAVCQAASGRPMIGDKMLRRATERRPRRIVAQRRHLMSHRGPLESRRRLGKRNLTGAMHPHAHPVPSWHIEVLSNATTWQWHAPTTPAERRIKAREISIPNLWGKFLKWLEMSDADKPFILPPKDIDDYPTFSRTIEDFRINIASLAVNDTKTAQEICQKFCVTIQEGILIGQICTQEMLVALDPFDAASRAVISEMRIGGKIFALIRSSIAEALEATQISRPDGVGDDMWAAMFNFVAGINGRFHDVSCFNKLITIMPESAKANISDETLFTYIKTFVQSQGTRDHRNPAWPWCCSKIGASLNQLSEGQRLSLFSSMNQHIRNAPGSADTKMKLSFAWLLTQAYDECLSNKAFIEIYQRSTENRMDHSGYRIWQLAVARLYSTGTLSKEAHRQVAGWNFHDSLPQRWTLLAKTLLASEQPKAAVASLCNFLADVGETWHLIEGLMTSHAEVPCGELLHTIASASGKLDIDIALRIAANDTKEGLQLLSTHSSASEPEHFAQFMSYPKAESYAWRAIKAKGGTVESKMELIDFLSNNYHASSNLSTSQKMRRARRAASYQMALTGKVSPAVMRNLIGAVTLDLDQGRWGRETQLQRAIQLVHDQVSPQAAQEMQKQLEGWRCLIHSATTQVSAPSARPLPEPDNLDMPGLRRALEDDVADEERTERLNRFTWIC